MASPLTGLPDELAGHQVRQGTPSLALPNGPRYPRIVQAWLWLKKPTWFLDRCSQAYGDVFTMRLPLGINLVHIGRPELVKAVFGGDNDVLRAGEANATILEPLVGPHSVLVLDGPERPFYQSSVVLDQAGQEPEVDDDAIARGSEIDHFAHRRGVFVSGDDEGARLDLPRVASLVKEGPDVAGIVFVVEVRGDVHAVHIALPSPDHASSVLGIRLRSTERCQQPIKLGLVGALEPDSEMRPLPSRQ